MATTKVPREMIIDALTEENYTSWAACMKSYLMKKGLWDIVEGTEPEPSPEDSSPESVTWRKQNSKALHAIQVSCGSKMFSYIIMESSAKAAWDCLASISSWHEHKIVGQIQPDAPVDNQGNHEKNIPYRSLYTAVAKGLWEGTHSILKKHPEAVRIQISTDGGTALHNAALRNHQCLVEELVKLMSKEDLELRTKNGATALHLAATGNYVKMAEAMINGNRNLLSLLNSDGYIPVCVAALHGGKKMLRYLYLETPDEVLIDKTRNGATLLSIAINVENYGLALDLLQRFPGLAISQDNKGRLCLNVLAQKLSSFLSGTQLSAWQRWIYKCCRVEYLNFYSRGVKAELNDKWSDIGNPSEKYNWSTYKIFGINRIYEIKVKHVQARDILERICDQLATLSSTQDLESLIMPAMFQAVETGNVEFITEMIKFYPALLRSRNELAGCIFHKAVAEREESIWNLIYSLPNVMINDIASMKNEFNNNLLHVAAFLPPQSRLKRVPGPAMQMQRELRWFKEVEDLVPTMMKEQRNIEGKTPKTLFDEQHRLLAKEGRIWMKDLATSCMLVAALIATVMFEGANNSWDKSHESEYFYEFYIFMISDALSLMSSTFSLLTFLSIFTSRYAQEDFLESLPNRFILGLSTLFFSIGTMMVAFAVLSFANLSLAEGWGALGFSSLSMIPVALFAAFHFPLLVQMVRYSYRSSPSNPETQLLFTQSPDSPLQIREVSSTNIF